MGLIDGGSQHEMGVDMPSKAVKPKWSIEDAIRVGRGALVLANRDRDAIERRLEAGLIDGLLADLDRLEGKRSEASRALTKLKEATRTQDAMAAEAKDFVVATRAAVARGRATKAEREAFGLSLRVNDRSVSSVVRALDAFVAGATKYPAVARAASTLPEDIERAHALRAALTAADAAQESTKVSKKVPVAERNATQVRVEDATSAIASAGLIAFAGNPQKAETYRALIPSRSRRRSTKPTA
jgi:hypothetical protein